MSKPIPNFKSDSGDEYCIPADQYIEDSSMYNDAVNQGDEALMMTFEEGMTGWIRCDG